MCGGSGTRLWPHQKNHQAKQFINFGGWTLFGKTLDRIKNSLFDSPIISTNKKYLKEVKKHLKDKKIKKYKIILEPIKMNTAPAILSTALIKDIPETQPLVFLSSDHLIEKTNEFNKSIKIHEKYLDNNNIFVFGIKPLTPSSEFGYFLFKEGIKKINIISKNKNIFMGGTSNFEEIKKVFKIGVDSLGVGSMFVFSSKKKGVLINYLSDEEKVLIENL